jgi:ssDNA-binding Zn-finger/Zn-ribbon topoisomerase 1
VAEGETLCWFGFCTVKKVLYSGGNREVKEKLMKGICPICGGKLRKQLADSEVEYLKTFGKLPEET